MENNIEITAKGIALVSALKSKISVEETENTAKVDGMTEFWGAFVSGLKAHPSAAGELFDEVFDNKRQKRREKYEDKIMRVIFALLGAGLVLLGQLSASLLP